MTRERDDELSLRRRGNRRGDAMRYATRWLAGAVDNVRNVAQNAPARARATYTHHTHTQRGHTHTNRAHVCACVRAHTYGSSTGLMLRRGVHVHTTYVHTSRNGGHAHAHAYAHARRTQRESRGAAHVWDLCARLTINVLVRGRCSFRCSTRDISCLCKTSRSKDPTDLG